MGGSSLSARGGTYRGNAPRPRRWWHKEPVVTSPARATDSEGVGDQSRRHARPESSRPCSLLLAARRPAHGLEAWAEVQRRGYEGLVAKDEASAYLGGRTRAWLKVKRRNGDGARSANGAARDLVQFSVDAPLHAAGREVGVPTLSRSGPAPGWVRSRGIDVSREGIGGPACPTRELPRCVGEDRVRRFFGDHVAPRRTPGSWG